MYLSVLDASSGPPLHLSSPGFVYRVVATPQTPCGIGPATSPRSIEVVPVVLVLLMRPWREGEVHKMGDGSLALAAVWILHAEQLSFCILIQRSKLLALLMLGLADL